MEEDKGESGDVMPRSRSAIVKDGPLLGQPIAEAHPGNMKMKQTLCLVTPDAMDHCEEIITILRREGFSM